MGLFARIKVMLMEKEESWKFKVVTHGVAGSWSQCRRETGAEPH